MLPLLLTACARAEGALAPTGVAAEVPTTDYSDQVEQSYLPDVEAASLAPVINYVDGLNLALTGNFEYIKTAATTNCGCLDIAKRLERLHKSATLIGGGVVGVAAATIAHGMRADVTIMDLDLKRLGQIDQIFAGNVKTLASSGYEIEKEVMNADLVIGAVLVHGAKAPKLVSNALVKKMKPGSVLVDVAIDQGGCFEDSKATTHQDPTYKVHDSIFYCVANMPGAVPATSTYALANATIKYGLALANKGWEKALSDDAALAKGLNVHEGKIYYEAVAKAHNL